MGCYQALLSSPYSSICKIASEINANLLMRCCTWSRRVAGGAICLMIFLRSLPCTVSIGERGSADFGIEFWNIYEVYKYFGLRVEISKKLKAHGWHVLPNVGELREPLLGLIILAD